LNDSFLHQLDSFQHLFKDTGLFTLKFDFEYDEHACDSGVSTASAAASGWYFRRKSCPFQTLCYVLGTL
jgi:hypothetical protein